MFCTVQLAAQAPPAPAAPRVASVCPDDHHANFHACATAAAKSYNPPRTAEGTPDLSGLWRRRAAAHEDMEAHPRNPDDAGGPSAVVVPADGKAPMQPWADVRRRENAQRYLHHNAACLLSGVPVTMYMTGLYQFLQTKDHLVVLSEESHAYLRTGPDHLLYEVTLEDPKVFTRPWTMRMPLYRRQEPNVQLLEYECYANQLTGETR